MTAIASTTPHASNIVSIFPAATPRAHRVAIVVPCYNEEKRLNLAAFSDFLQRVPGIRLIFVNDGKGMGLVHHSDRGSQYLSIRYTERQAEAGIEPSVGSVGDSYDNALAETINGLF